MTKVFITGIQGLIGWNLYQDLRGDHQVFGFSKTRRDHAGEWYEGLLEDYRYIQTTLEHTRPELIIHTQAMCNLDLCEQKPEKTELINVEATEKLLDSLDPKRHRLVYLSSEHVFSGAHGPYVEDSPRDPISVYGRTRVQAEAMIQARFPQALIIRPGLAMGESLQGDIGPHDWLLSRVKRGLVASFFTDEIRSPIWMSDLIQGIRFLIQKGCSGVYHLASDVKLSRYDIAQQLLSHWGLQGNIQKKLRRDEKIIPRIGNCSLDCSKAAQAGWTVPSFQVRVGQS